MTSLMPNNHRRAGHYLSYGEPSANDSIAAASLHSGHGHGQPYTCIWLHSYAKCYIAWLLLRPLCLLPEFLQVFHS
jgi:hypothetical protein